jgi:hypothetical protein
MVCMGRPLLLCRSRMGLAEQWLILNSLLRRDRFTLISLIKKWSWTSRFSYVSQWTELSGQCWDGVDSGLGTVESGEGGGQERSFVFVS